MTLALAEQYQQTRRLVEAGVLPRSALEALEAELVDWRGVTSAQAAMERAAAATARAAEATREAARAAVSAKYWERRAEAEADEALRLEKLDTVRPRKACLDESSLSVHSADFVEAHGLPAWVIAQLARAEANAPDPPELSLVMTRPPWRT